MKIRLLDNEGRTIPISDVAEIVVFTDEEDPVMFASETSGGAIGCSTASSPNFAEDLQHCGLAAPDVEVVKG